MGFDIKKSKRFQELTRKQGGLADQVRSEFDRRGPLKVKQAIIQDMIRGISPVQGGGKWKKYSDSYKATIKGKTTFRTINGKVIAMKGRDTEYLGKSSPTKGISPVNLRHTGALHHSLTVFRQARTLVIQFRNALADIHNRLGAGKSKVIRRILPTEAGEKFNKRINQVILDELKKAVDKIAKSFS